MGKQDSELSGYKKRRKIISKEKLKKVSKKDEKERAKIADEATREALKKSVSLLSQSLKVPGAVKNLDFANSFTSEVETVLSGIHADAVNEESGTVQSSGKKGTGNKDKDGGEESSSKRSSSKRQDSHNESCEVCDAGGDLLCCDTCNLVFHLTCIRPKLAAVPKGKWSCAYCVVEGAAKGESDSAKRAIRSMKDLRRSRDLPCEGDDESRSNRHRSDLTVIRMGRQFVTRRLVHGQIVEMDRHNTLEKALFEIKTILDHKKGELARRVGDTGDLFMGVPETPHGTEAMHADGELWCIYCMDDASIPICAFCGCKTCFGKHSAENLLLCDGCDHEWHLYCLDPPLESIPEGHWFCKGCIKSGRDKEVLEEEEQDRLADEALERAQAEIDAAEAAEDAAMRDMLDEADLGGAKKKGRKSSGAYMPQQLAPAVLLGGGQEEAPVARRPGRPKGSVGKKKADLLNASCGGNMQTAIRVRKRETLPHISTQTSRGKKRRSVVGEWESSLSQAEMSFDGPIAIKDAIGLDFSKLVANRAARRLLLPIELVSMEKFRAWAPICDLREALATFQQKKEMLMRYISGDAMNEGYFPETSDSTDQLNPRDYMEQPYDDSFDSGNYDALMEGGMMFDDQELNAEGFGDQYLEASDPISMDS